MNTTKVLIIEDDPIIAKDISSLLKSEGYNIVGVAHDATTALDYLASRGADFVMLDIYLGPGMNGIDIAEVIHQKYKIPYIFLTSFSDTETLEAAKLQAPYGYLVKPFQDRTLLTTIVIALNNYQKEQELKKADSTVVFDKQLTGQEKKMVEELLKGSSYKQIAEQMFVSVNTVKYHLKNIYAKLEVSGRAELLSKVIQQKN